MTVPAAEPPVGAEALAGRAVLTHMTVDGERVALIVPASLMELVRILGGLLASKTASGELPRLLADVYPWVRHLPDQAVRDFAVDLGEALLAGADAPDKVEAEVASWRATAEAYADPDVLAALRAPISDCGPVPEPVVG